MNAPISDPLASVAAGRWVMPPAVADVADAQVVGYDNPPPWIGQVGCGGGLLPGTRALGDYVKMYFAGVRSVEGYACRPNTANTSQTSVHGTGRAADIMIPPVGGRANNVVGDPIANWLAMHAQEIGVQLIIWDKTIWNPSHSEPKARAYTGPNPHLDHVHVELTVPAAQQLTPWFGGGNQQPPDGGGAAGDGGAGDASGAGGAVGGAAALGVVLVLAAVGIVVVGAHMHGA